MTKELQNKAWSVLPKEFKEEVKYEYTRVATKATKDSYDLGFMHAHEELFGLHNLDSDAEGEESLQERMWNVLTPELQTYCRNMGHTSHNGNVEDVLDHLFGSKCLPDGLSEVKRDLSENLSEPKPSEPKFKVAIRQF